MTRSPAARAMRHALVRRMILVRGLTGLRLSRALIWGAPGPGAGLKLGPRLVDSPLEVPTYRSSVPMPILQSFLLTTLLAGAAGIDGPQEPSASAATRVVVDFVELAAAPELWLGETIETIVQVRGVAAGAWEGYLSGLSPRTHIALDVWADSQLLWDSEEFNAPAGRLYAEPVPFFGAASASVFRPEGAPRTWAKHTRLRAVVRVEAFTAGRGWIVLLAAEPTDEQVPEGTVLHAIRGLALAKEQSHELAASELDKALLPPLPDHARRPLEAARDRARAALQRSALPASTPRRRGAAPR